MTDPKNMDFDRWRELAELLGLPTETPPPEEQARPASSRGEPRDSASAVKAKDRATETAGEPGESDVTVLEEPEALADAVDDVVDTEVLPPESLDEGEAPDAGAGEEEPRKRRRRRRGRRGRAGEPAAPEAAEENAEASPSGELEANLPAELAEVESEQEPIDPLELGPPKREPAEDSEERGRRRRRRRRGRGRGKDREPSENITAEGGEDEPRRSEPLDDRGADVEEFGEGGADGHDLDDDAPLPNEFEHWDVPPWQELIDSLYRPDR